MQVGDPVRPARRIAPTGRDEGGVAGPVGGVPPGSKVRPRRPVDEVDDHRSIGRVHDRPAGELDVEWTTNEQPSRRRRAAWERRPSPAVTATIPPIGPLAMASGASSRARSVAPPRPRARCRPARAPLPSSRPASAHHEPCPPARFGLPCPFISIGDDVHSPAGSTDARPPASAPAQPAQRQRDRDKRDRRPEPDRPATSDISTSAAGCRREGAMAAPSSGPAVHARSTGCHPPLIRGFYRRWSARLRPSSLDDTLQGREAGESPAQSRYGDHRLDPEARWKSGRRPAVAAQTFERKGRHRMRSPG